MLLVSSACFAYSEDIGRSLRAAANRAAVIGVDSADIVMTVDVSQDRCRSSLSSILSWRGGKV